MAGENAVTVNDLLSEKPSETFPDSERFKISPLIQFTLMSLYVALVVPLPFLAEMTHSAVPPTGLWIGIVAGAGLLYGILSERVEVNEAGIAVTYPVWMQALGRRGWALAWDEITALKPRSTGQGGIVYYFVSKQQDRAYLLPVRVVGFARLVRYVAAKTELDTRDVKPLAQPWMYVILLGLTALLLLVDIWAIAQSQSSAQLPFQSGLLAPSALALLSSATLLWPF